MYTGQILVQSVPRVKRRTKTCALRRGLDFSCYGVLIIYALFLTLIRLCRRWRLQMRDVQDEGGMYSW
jgi:hypothetical protein